MSLVGYTITAFELNQADATASGKQVVVGASCSMFLQPADTAVLLYDNAAGSNGSTAKTTGVNGQVNVYIEPANYRLVTNSISRFVQVGMTVGTAATADVTSSSTDTTAGRVLRAQDAYAVNSINFHTGNANFNVFGGITANRSIAKGFRDTATTGLIFLHINSLTNPSGITNISTFKLRNASAETDVGIPSADLQFNSASSNRQARVRVVNLSSGTVGEPIELITETATSKITVNF